MCLPLAWENFREERKKGPYIKAGSLIPYNGIFSHRQIFAVLSQKHSDYFSRILIFAVGNIRKIVISILFRENRGGGGITQLSLDRPTVRKENLQPKYLKRKGIKDTCSLTYKKQQQNRLTYRRLNKITVQGKTIKYLSYTWTLKVVSYDTFCHKTTHGVFWM